MPITNISDELPLIGYPGPGFAGIHVTGLVCLSVSTVVSSGLLCYLCVCIRHPVKRFGSRKKRFQTPKIENQSVQTVTSSPPAGRSKTKGEQEKRQQIPEIVAEQSDAKDSVNLTQNDLDNAPSDGTSLTSSRNRIDWSTSELDLPRKTFERPEKAKKRKGIPFWKWNIGERIVVYLAICDLGFSATDISNHAYLYFMVRHPRMWYALRSDF